MKRQISYSTVLIWALVLFLHIPAAAQDSHQPRKRGQPDESQPH